MQQNTYFKNVIVNSESILNDVFKEKLLQKRLKILNSKIKKKTNRGPTTVLDFLKGSQTKERTIKTEKGDLNFTPGKQINFLILGKNFRKKLVQKRFSVGRDKIIRLN